MHSYQLCWAMESKQFPMLPAFQILLSQYGTKFGFLFFFKLLLFFLSIQQYINLRPSTPSFPGTPLSWFPYRTTEQGSTWQFVWISLFHNSSPSQLPPVLTTLMWMLLRWIPCFILPFLTTTAKPKAPLMSRTLHIWKGAIPAHDFFFCTIYYVATRGKTPPKCHKYIKIPDLSACGTPDNELSVFCHKKWGENSAKPGTVMSAQLPGTGKG